MISTKELVRQAVPQEDGLGCAVACTAFVIGDSYKDTLKLFKDGARRVREEANFYCPEIVSILNHCGLKYSWKELVNDNKELIDNNLTIVFMDRSIRYPVGHFLVRYKDKWMDPWINLPDKNIVAGFRDSLPGIPTYVIYSTEDTTNK